MHESMFLEEIFWLFEIIHQYVRLARPKKKKNAMKALFILLKELGKNSSFVVILTQAPGVPLCSFLLFQRAENHRVRQLFKDSVVVWIVLFCFSLHLSPLEIVLDNQQGV